MRQSEMLIGAIAEKIHEQGRPFAQIRSDGDTHVGRILRGGRLRQEHYYHPGDAIETLMKRKALLNKCETTLHWAVKGIVVFSAAGALKGIRERSVKEIGLVSLIGTPTAMAARLGEEISNQTAGSLERRINLLINKRRIMSTPQEQPPEKQ